MVGKAYTATVTLTANENYVFAANQNLSVSINGQNAAVTNNGSTITLSYAFAIIADSANVGMDGTTEATAFKVYDVATLNRVGKGTGDWVGNWSLSAHYEQIADIILPPVNEGESNWIAIGGSSNLFTGTYNGGEYTISNLTINISADYQGMFGYIGTGGIVKNVGLVGGSVSGGSFVGGVVGMSFGGTVQNCYSTGSGSGNNHVGGVVGNNYNSGTVQDCYFTGSVSGNNYGVGGVVGDNRGAVQNCYSTGSVSGSSSNGVGGVVGESDFGGSNGTVQNCYSTVSVSVSGSGVYVGGVVGRGGLRNSSNEHQEGTAVQNCVALNNNSGTSIRRRIGVIVTGSIGNIFKNNYARSDMTLTNYTPTPDLNGEDGANITSAQYNSESWWKNAGNWRTTDGGSAWDFVNVWEWGANNLPILRNVGGVQNHTVQ